MAKRYQNLTPKFPSDRFARTTVRHGSAPDSLAPYSATVVLLDPRD
ncbi:hypothetical protein ACFV1W_19845 [Kitasatospora sp. NPDC059648]